MKIKNIVLVLVAALLVLLHPGTVEAYEDKCGCGGDFMTKYIDPLLPVYRWRGFNHKIYDGYFNNYTVMDFGRGANGDICFFVEAIYSYSSSNSNKNYTAYVIYISEDEAFDCYDMDGNIIQKDLSDLSSNGIANNKFYGFYGIAAGSAGKWVHEYDDGYNYFIHTEGVHSEVLNKLEELAIFLCGGDNAIFPDGVTAGAPLPVYDLEPPLNVFVNGIDNNIFETKSKSVKIRWEQSNIDLTGYKTVFYMRESGRCRKTIFNEWQDVKTPWLFDKDYITAKYCNNNLKYHEYKWWTDQSKLGDYANAKLYGDETGGLMCEHAAVDFMIRNEKEDEDGTLHYSSWVYVNCFEDGTYQIYEMNEDYTLDEDPDETGNINTDSTIYDDEAVYDEDDVDASLGIGDAKDFVGGMTDLINSLRSFPALFSKIFSFFPSWVLGMIGMLFIAVLLSRLFL